MAQVIIFQNPTGPNVCVCTPTGDIPIEDVLSKDCPKGAVIVDESTLPQDSDSAFFDAWVLGPDNTITVNFSTAQEIYLVQFNAAAVKVAAVRGTNTIAGLPNVPDNATWSAQLTTGRNAIASATTTAELLAIPLPSSG